MLIKKVLSVDSESWIVKQVIALDWYDGSREGFCWLELPDIEFYYKLIDERECEDDFDDRIFFAKGVPCGTCSELLDKLSKLGTPTSKEWCPAWSHPDRTYLKEVDTHIDSLINNSLLTSGFVFWSRNMVRFLRCWSEPENADSIQDWFTHLKI